MEGSVWEILGIEPTTDERALKRAYAVKLKVTSPESDPAGYMRLREAYEAAKGAAAFQRMVADPAAHAPPGESALFESSAAQAPPVFELPVSPQRQAIARLHALVAERRLEELLQEVESIRDAQTFATLDEQQDFVGEVATAVVDAQIGDAQWRGRLAAALGARANENIFPQGNDYWYAYERLLEDFAHFRDVAARSHADGKDDITATPGYLHVYHVLTAPFDSERLMALTRSRTYYRLAEIILQRSTTDPSIAIPVENRDWWQRTAMASQHNPVEEPAIVRRPTGESSSFPYWILWIFFVFGLQLLRTCDGTDSSPSVKLTPEQMERALQAAKARQEARMKNAALYHRIESCDPEIRVQLMEHQFKARGERDPASATSPESRYPIPILAELDENDPVIAALLAKCPKPPSP